MQKTDSEWKWITGETFAYTNEESTEGKLGFICNWDGKKL